MGAVRLRSKIPLGRLATDDRSSCSARQGGPRCRVRKSEERIFSSRVRASSPAWRSRVARWSVKSSRPGAKRVAIADVWAKVVSVLIDLASRSGTTRRDHLGRGPIARCAARIRRSDRSEPFRAVRPSWPMVRMPKSLQSLFALRADAPDAAYRQRRQEVGTPSRGVRTTNPSGLP